MTKALLIINTIVEVLSLFTGWTFYVNSQNFAHHGPFNLFYVFVFVSAIILVIVAFLKYGSEYGHKNRKELFFIMLLIAISIILQEGVGQGIKTDYLGMAIGTVLLYIYYIEFDQIHQDQILSQKDAQLSVDALTGALSRFSYMNLLQNYSETNNLPEGLVVLEADLNGLKYVNDTFGHDAGDELLRKASDVLNSSIGLAGKVYRVGGDEFIILLHSNLLPAAELENKIREDAKLWRGSYRQKLSFSIGYASLEEFPSYSLSQLVQVADKRMYRDKARFYSMPGNDRRIRRR